jgi:hypothetical protein
MTEELIALSRVFFIEHSEHEERIFANPNLPSEVDEEVCNEVGDFVETLSKGEWEPWEWLTVPSF